MKTAQSSQSTLLQPTNLLYPTKAHATSGREGGAPHSSVTETPFTRPTMSEGLVPLFEGVPTASVAKAPLRKRREQMAHTSREAVRV